MNYHGCNGCKRFYIGGSLVKVYVVLVVCVWGIMRLGVMLIVLVCLIL